jgi:hypothetical protein
MDIIVYLTIAWQQEVHEYTMAAESSGHHRFKRSGSNIKQSTEPISHPKALLKSGDFSVNFSILL